MEILKRARKDRTYFARKFFGVELHGKQVEAVNLEGRQTVKVCGRRFGKTLTTAISVTHSVLTTPNSQWIITGPSLSQAKLYNDEIYQHARKNPLLDLVIKDFKQSPFPEIHLVNGSKILFRSSANQGKFIRGNWASGIAVTEAAWVNETVVKEVMEPMMAQFDGTMHFESSPANQGWFYDLFQKGMSDPSGDVRSFHATSFDNPLLSRERLEKIRENTPAHIWLVEYMAQFITDSSYVFGFHDLQKMFENEDDDFRQGDKELGHWFHTEHPKYGTLYSIGCDLGKMFDYTCIVVMDLKRRKIVEFFRFRDKPYHQVQDLLNALSDKYNRADVVLDASGLGKVVEEGINRVIPFVFTAKTRPDLLSNLVMMVEKHQISAPAALTILKEEMRWFKNVKHGDRVKPEAEKGHDDTVMALALSVWPLAEGVIDFAKTLGVSGPRKSTVKRKTF